MFAITVITSVWSCVENVVSSRLCNDPRPTHVEVCNVACANDCVTSSWSEWSSCSRTCSVGRVSGHRTRFLDILAHAGQGIQQFIASCSGQTSNAGHFLSCKVLGNFPTAALTFRTSPCLLLTPRLFFVCFGFGPLPTTI